MSNWNTRIKRSAEARGVGPSELAKACGIKPASVSGWFSGDTKSLEAANALKACHFLKINMEWLLFGNLPSGLEEESASHIVEQYVAPYGDSKSLNIPLMNATGSMGTGDDMPVDEVVVEVLRLSRSWLDRQLPGVTDIGNLAFIHAKGDSMAGTFNDGDILLVDTGVKQIQVDAVYVLEAYDRLFIKRVRQRLDGEYEISSDNPNVKTVDILNGKNAVNIRGRVIWIWNGKKL
jgi:phage repressor protein C with HTH and peptisase S24 domain